MKKIDSKLIVLLCMLCSLFTACDREQTQANYQIIPLPKSIELGDSNGFIINKNTKISFPEGNQELKRVASFLAEYISFASDLNLLIKEGDSGDNTIFLKTGYNNENKDAYLLTVDEKNIIIDGSTEAGTFYGIQTLYKSIPVNSENKDIFLQNVRIEDAPRFAYRGMHLDVARHYFSVDFIKKYIDVIALHNINKFHLHLTDDQGWRVEIKKYPKLTKIGSIRKGTLIGHNETDKPHRFDDIEYGGFYTQEQLKEIVAYANDRFIEIIPEIDLPGHMLAALAAYPEFGCVGEGYEVGRRWGVYDDVLCAGKEETYKFVEDVLTEIMDIFPSKLIHIGGDECPKVRWEKCPKCQTKIKELNIKPRKGQTAEAQLQSQFMARIEVFLNNHGRNIIGWDEILEGGATPNVTIMSWRGTQGGIDAARQHHDVIMTPYDHLYFDYNQGADKSKEPLSIGGYLPIEKVYTFEPVPEELTEKEKQYIIGVQANLWTEYFKTEDIVEYMLIPRIDALAEIQWVMPENKEDYNSFLERLNRMFIYYDKAGYNYAKHVTEKTPEN